ncbi:hypothetical protein FJ651_14845 [Paucihalobacter ruber]|uniref:Superfamily III holin-X n=1 Tax=Paucihalobacter ruber TaxID=2567861 RepID=A0A506PEH0_9FLAO|nr:hypothetical protein [Paucihalobacter ruber]TPV31467.1 hypothetical protein FJ651_14845 [Paucihalobacter ruber]
MNIFESVSKSTGKMSDSGETYIKKTQEYYTLKVFQQLTISASLIAKALIIGGLLLIVLFFLAFAAAMALGNILNNIALGYVSVAGIFLLFTAIIYFNRHLISNKIIKTLSHKFFD